MARKSMLTNKERRELDRLRRELKAKGILPPDKPRLNRRQFARETLKEYQEDMDLMDSGFWLNRAIRYMVSEEMEQVSEEQVGVLKLLKLAVESKKFHQDLKAEGRTQYTAGELIDKVVSPVLRL